MGRRHTTALRVLAIVLVVLAVGVSALTVTVRHRFPPEEVARLLSGFLSEKTGYRVSISEVRFNLLRGFEVFDLRLGAPAQSQGLAPVDSVYIRRLRLQYRPSQLFHRVLTVTGVEVESPHIWLSPESGVRRDSPSAPPASASPASTRTLPVAVDLKRLRVRDLGVSLRLSQTGDSLDAETHGWDFALSGLSVRRDGVPSLRELTVDHPEGALQVRFVNDTLRISSRLPLRFALRLHGTSLPDSGQLQLSLSLNNDETRLAAPHRRVTIPGTPVLIGLHAEGFLSLHLPRESDSLRQNARRPSLVAVFPALRLRLLGSTPFAGHLRLEADSSRQHFALALGPGSFPVAEWVDQLRGTVPELFTQLDSTSLRSLSLQLSYLEAQGDGRTSPAETLAVSLSGSVGTPRFLYPPSQVEVDSLRTDFDLAGSLVRGRPSRLDVHTLTVAAGAAVQSGTRFISLNNVTLDVGSTLDSTLWLRTADLDFEIDDALGGTAYVRSHWFTPGKHASLRGEVHTRLTGLQVANLTDQPLHGQLDFQSSFRVPGDGSVVAAASWVADSLILETPEQPIAFPPLRGQFKGRGRFDPVTRKASLRNWQLWLPGFLVTRGDLQVLRDSVLVELRRLRVQPGNIVDWARPLLPENSADLVLGGTVTGSARGRFSPRASAVAGSLQVLDGLFAEPASEFTAGQINFGAAFSGTLDSLTLRGSGEVDSLVLGSFGRRPLRRTAVDLVATLFPGQSLIRLDSVAATHAPLGLHAHGRGEISTVDPDTEVVKIDYSFTMAADSFGPLGDVARLRGRATGFGQVHMFGDLLHVRGQVDPRTLCARLNTGVELDTIAGHASYDFWLDLAGEEPVFLVRNPRDFPNPLRETRYVDWRWLALPADTLYVKHIRFLRYRLESLRADVVARNGFVYVPLFRVNAYGGAVGGRVLLDFRNRTSLSAAFRADVQISRLNTTLLNPKRRRKESYVTGTIRLQGQGFLPQDLVRVRGLVQFTELGPTVADDILASLDPSGVNPGIRNTRRLLALGFRPLRMSFQLRQGYFYPSLRLKQPWFSPIRLSGGRIDMGRLPLEPFLRTAQAGGGSP